MNLDKIKTFSLIVILLFSFFQVKSQQQLSTNATVSVITCGPGNELYSAFGHSAFRVSDPILGLDKIYNYGTFDFNAPNFYLNFAKGKLIYLLSTSDFSRFLRSYQYENRWVKTQVLNLSNEEVQQMFNFLENNAKPENRDYQYDFFYDNCSTKIEEVVQTVLKDKVIFSNNHISSNKSHRDLIADYTKDFKWGKFGIDLALGSVIDDNASKNDYKFLPDYIFEAFTNATIQKNGSIEPLVNEEMTILKEISIEKQTEYLSPFNVILAISLLIIFITYKNHQQSKRNKTIDFSIYFFTGIIGIVVLLLWFASSHTATYKNYNFLWAFAPNIVVAFFMLKCNLQKWISIYNGVLLMLLIIMILLWVLKIQIFNIAIIPLIMALGIRLIYLISFNQKSNY